MLRNTRLFERVFLFKILRARRCKVFLHSWRPVLFGSNHNSDKTNIFRYHWRYFTTWTFIQNRALCTEKVPEISCWKCNFSHPVNTQGTTQFFCHSCKVIQEPLEGKTCFDILDCEQTFDIETKHLTNIYHRLQSQLHPDKFSLKSDKEQLHSSLQSSVINEAYQTLLKPLSRGLYLLELHQLSIEEGNISNDIDFLSDIMEMNETLEHGSETALNELKSQIKENLESCIQNISDAFQNNHIEAAKEVLSKMKYFDNINEQIKEKLMAK